MSKKAHGTSDKPVVKDRRWGCDYETADRICNFNRHYAEYAGYWQTTEFLKSIEKEEKPINFYDSVTGELLFTAPVGRSMEDFIKESRSHGWPSFRDTEVCRTFGVYLLVQHANSSLSRAMTFVSFLGQLGTRSMPTRR